MNIHPGYTMAMASTSTQPLPLPWTEHVAPSGYLYYYNPSTSESTYNRPISLAHLSAQPKQKRKKEKPATKTPVPESSWLRVLTNRGNAFYHNAETKESIWDVPGDIESAIEAMDAMELETKAEDASLGIKRKERDEDEETRAGKRPKREDDDDPDDEEWQRQLAEEMAEEHTEEPVEPVPPEPEPVPTMPLEEATQLFKIILQDAQLNPLHPWEKTLPLLTSSPNYTPLLEHSLSAAAQRDIFEEYCKELVAARRAQEPSAKPKGSGDLLEAYRQLLKDTVTSTRMTYTQFRQQVKKDRKFYSFGRDEKEREREFRNYLKELGEHKKNERKKAEEAFLAMLKESRHLRADAPKKWADVKKEFQKDSRYDAVGSSTLREELYDTYLKSLGEATASKADEAVPDAHVDTTPAKLDEDEKKKRREKAVREREERVRFEKERTARENARSRAGLNLEEAELAFNSLLIDAIRDPTTSFTAALSYLSADPRFTSISQASAMSQTRLNNLFQAHITRLQEKGNTALHALFESHAPGLDARWEDLAADVKASIAGSAIAKRLGLDGQVSTRPKRRDHHRRRSRDRSRDDSMDDEDEKEQYEYPALRNEFETWQRRRFTAARSAFDTMLSENAFVEFWGRVGKMGLTDQDEKVRLGKMVFADENAAGTGAMEVDEEEDGQEGEGGGGKRDLQTLAKGVDVKEVERVLRRDKRFIVFDYMPEEREQWLAEYLGGLSAPKASVHIG